jgi:PAS domain S-box-containing protein
MRAEESRAMAENLFVGDGKFGALLRSRDWSQTPLGDIETWSDDLKKTVQILITELDQANPTEKTPLDVDLRQNSSAAALDQANQLNAFRIKLVDALRPLTDASEIQAIAARILGEALGATRVIYIEVVSNGEEAIVHQSYTNGVAELSGRYRLEDYRRNLTQDHQAGRTQVVTDIPNDPKYANAEKARYCEIDIAAYIDVPLIKNNQFVALLAAQQSTPRQWTETEVKLVEETAERTWAAVERAHAEAALRESEAKYRTLFESIDQGFCVIEVLFAENSKPVDYRFLEINPAFENQTGLINVQGKRMRELAPHHEAHWFEIYGNIALTGEPSRFENCAAALNRWYDVYAFRIGHPDERKVAVLFNDITDRKRIEDERKHVEQERDRFLAVGSDLQVITGSDGYFRWVSPTFERLLGWTAAEMMSQPWTEFVHPDDIPASELETASLFSGDETFEFENRYRHKDGSYRWLLWNAKPYPTEQTIYGAAVDITERKQTEVALRESEERFRTLTATIPQLIWTATPNGSVDYLSQQWADYIGLPPEQLYDRHWQDVVHPKDLPNTLSGWSHSLQTGKPLEIKHRFRFRTGEWRWQLVRGTPIKDETGQVTKWVGTCTDIQSEMDAQAMLHQSEARLRTVAANLPNGAVFIVDRELRYQLAEGKALEEAGFTAQDLVGKTIWQVLDPSLAVIYESYFRQALNGEPFSWEHSSHDRYYISHGTPLYSSRGEVEAVLAVSYDITDRKQAEEAIRQSEARYRLLAEAIPQFVWITDAAGQNEYVNQRFCDYTGLTAEQMRGSNWLSIIHPDDLEITRDRWLMAVNSGQFYEIEYRLRHFDGSYRWFLGQGIPLKDEQGQVYKWFGTCTDIEPQKQIEQARLQLLEQEQNAREQAETANRMKDEFLAVLSHELRSPLNPILGWTRLLQNGNLDAARQGEALETIERNARLQTQLIEDLLDISRIMRGKLSLTVAPVSLAFVISAAVETVRLAAEAKNTQIILDLASGVAPVAGDAARLQQVVWNLLTNAVKFTPNGGQVTVELRQLNGLAQIRVMDTGKGINPQFLPHVFEYFRQEDSSTTRKFGGLGLGLAIARQIVEMHGGTVWAESQGEGMGATFIVELPLLKREGVGERESAGEPHPLPSSPPHPLSGVHILLVDDELDAREFQAFLLKQNGAMVTAVASGYEALQSLERSIPDVVVSDIGMAEMDGYMLLQQIRSRPSEQGGMIPAIALTAYATETDQRRVLQAGFQTHIKKPVEPEELVGAIAELLNLS